MKSITNDISESEISKPQVKYWYTVYVRSRHEKKVHQLFQENGFEILSDTEKDLFTFIEARKV